MNWQLFAIQLLNGVQLGLLLFLLAAGLTLIFGLMDFVNLAHGAFYMLGAYFTATLFAWSGWFGLALVLGVLAALAVGAAVEWGVARRLAAHAHLDQVLVTFGLILLFDGLVHLLWGADGRVIALPASLDRQLVVGELVFPLWRLVIAAGGLAAAGALWYVIGFTRLGLQLRAAATHREMLGALGVDIGRLQCAVFAVGAGLAGLAGGLIGPVTGIGIGMGNQIIIIALVVVIVGGVGSVRGAFFAALLVGLGDSLGRAYLDDGLKRIFAVETAETVAPALSSMLVYVLLLGVLLVRPRGLFPLVRR